MTKYGTRNNKVKAKEVTAEKVIVSTELDLNLTTVGTAATGTAAYIPVVVNGETRYIMAKL